MLMYIFLGNLGQTAGGDYFGRSLRSVILSTDYRYDSKTL